MGQSVHALMVGGDVPMDLDGDVLEAYEDTGEKPPEFSEGGILGYVIAGEKERLGEYQVDSLIVRFSEPYREAAEKWVKFSVWAEKNFTLPPASLWLVEVEVA